MEDAVYQRDRMVARVSDAQVDADSREIHFREIYDSDDLMLPDECEFRNYRILIRKIEYAARADKQSLNTGRVLKEVVAEILGYREH